MGEKIKELGSIIYKNQKYKIELNTPPANGMNNQIHIQSQNARCELDENDFLRIAISILVSEKNLKNIKNIK